MKDSRDLAEQIYRAAVAACHPRQLVRSALESSPLPATGDAIWMIAVGKAADGMIDAALSHLAEHGVQPGGAIAIGEVVGMASDQRIERHAGNHPLPSERSAAAAGALGEFVGRIPRDAHILVLISGGTSSLIGAPAPGVRLEDYRALCAALLQSGQDIVAVNAVRRRFARWGGGRLGLALSPRPVSWLAISDVPGDDATSIGSGPLCGDPLRPADVARMLGTLTLKPHVKDALLAWLNDPASETPTPGDPRLAHVFAPTVISAHIVRDEALRAARALGVTAVRAQPYRLTGSAADAGAAIARDLVQLGAAVPAGGSGVFLAWGETTVSLPAHAPPGGRCQHLALTAARTLGEARAGPARYALLAAGTDGRDGPTNAAGAIVDSDTWSRIRAKGIDPDTALASFASRDALDAADALIPRWATGTNVGDLVVGVVTRSY